MRIALFTETFLPKVDGIVNTLCYLLEHLANRGHQSLLFAPTGHDSRYARTPIVGFWGCPVPFYQELRLVPPTVTIRAHLRAFRPDVVHLLNPVSLGLAGMWHSRRLRIPVIASYHTDLPGFAERWGLPAFRQPLWTFFRWVHNKADLNLSPSRATLAELQMQGFKNVKVWTRGVDTSRFHPQHHSQEMRDYLANGRSGAPLLLFVSRLSPEKRADWLLPVLQAMPEARLAIVGDGPARPQLEKQFARTNTVFTGYLRGQALAQAYASADAFVFPAANETLGNVVLEAMASGLPVVAARSGGPVDTIVEGRTGLFFEPESQTSLVQTVQQIFKDASLAQKLSQFGRIYAESRGWSMILDELIEDYETAVLRKQNMRPRSISKRGATHA